MSDSPIAISVRGLGKSYTIRKNEERHFTFAEASLARLRRPLKRAEKETFWALQDIDFEIRRGEVVGVIGRNGAGKSTLLKVLSRITRPTTGAIDVWGRIGSLLEVGTGFHPELTGRENVFLNGAILGMRREEIQREFDAIVAFAGVEKFLETPVKRYSSGMYVRLAFAVAAHLRCEVLLVDEVLAVGDAEFQDKCLGKMKDVARDGRTVLLVSHNMASIRRLCTTALLLEKGRASPDHDVAGALAKYLQGGIESDVRRERNAHGVLLESAVLLDDRGTAVGRPHFMDPCHLVLDLHFDMPITRAAVLVGVHDETGQLVGSVCNVEEGANFVTLEGTVRMTAYMESLRLLPGRYTVRVQVRRSDDATIYLHEDAAVRFEVQPVTLGDAAWPYRREHGMVRLFDGITLRRGDATEDHPWSRGQTSDRVVA